MVIQWSVTLFKGKLKDNADVPTIGPKYFHHMEAIATLHRMQL